MISSAIWNKKARVIFLKTNKIIIIMQKQIACIIIIMFYLPYLHNTKNIFTAVTARRRGDPGSHRAYGRATSLTLINKV